MHEGKLAYTVF